MKAIPYVFINRMHFQELSNSHMFFYLYVICIRYVFEGKMLIRHPFVFYWDQEHITNQFNCCNIGAINESFFVACKKNTEWNFQSYRSH